MKSPAFQFYPDDFLGSGKVGTMTVDEVGAYTLLLCLDWNENGFVFDEEELARWCRVSRARFRKLWVRVSRCFEEHGGRMCNPRLQLEREKQAEWRAKSAKGGKASAQAKVKGGSRVVQPPAQPNVNTPSPTPSPTLDQQQQNGATAPAIRVATAPRAKRPTLPWMGAMRSAWTFGDLLPGDATLLAPVVGAVGEEEAVRRLGRYCGTVDPEFASVRSFVAKHATYADGGGRPAVDPVSGLPNAAGIAALTGRRG